MVPWWLVSALGFYYHFTFFVSSEFSVHPSLRCSHVVENPSYQLRNASSQPRQSVVLGAVFFRPPSWIFPAGILHICLCLSRFDSLRTSWCACRSIYCMIFLFPYSIMQSIHHSWSHFAGLWLLSQSWWWSELVVLLHNVEIMSSISDLVHMECSLDSRQSDVSYQPLWKPYWTDFHPVGRGRHTRRWFSIGILQSHEYSIRWLTRFRISVLLKFRVSNLLLYDPVFSFNS